MHRETLIKGAFKAIINAVMLLFSFTCIFPIIWMIYSSLKSREEFSMSIISLPAQLRFDNYINAMKTGKMEIYFLNSIITSLISVVLVIVIAFITGYFLSRYKFRGRNFLYALFLLGMLVPVHGLLVPVFVLFRGLNMLDNRFTLILPYVAFGLPISIFLAESFIKSIPIQIEEAAFIDGSPITKTLAMIILPMCRPVIATVLILSFLNAWNEFPFALILVKSQKLRTLPVGLTNFSGQYTVNYTQLMAALVVAILPVMLIYLLFHKKIIQGMTAGAVKG